MDRRPTVALSAERTTRNPLAPKMGRPYPTHTKLGKLMAEQGWVAADLSLVTGIYTRTLTEYLAGRKQIKDDHLVALCDALDVGPTQLL
jgi:DNA-binding Xre family transcriptional regulator